MKKTGRDFLAAIFYDCLPRAVVQRDMTPLAALRVEAYGDVAVRAELKDPIDEFLALHDL